MSTHPFPVMLADSTRQRAYNRLRDTRCPSEEFHFRITLPRSWRALDLEQAGDAMIVGRGAIAEQFVGQHLLYGRAPSVDPDLYFWAREKKGTSSEVDYVVSVGPCVVPVEVKAGATGRLKSLHVFLEQKGRTLGVRLNSEPPSLLHERTAVPGSPPIDYQLLSLPLYLVGQLRRLVRETLGRS